MAKENRCFNYMPNFKKILISIQYFYPYIYAQFISKTNLNVSAETLRFVCEINYKKIGSQTV